MKRVHHADFAREVAAEAKAASGRTVSLCLPARNEARTIGAIIGTVAGHPLLDEVLVLDDHSRDGTGRVAAAAGARVVHAGAVLGDHPPGPGKGQALWRATAASSGDIVAFCDADLHDFSPHFVDGLVGPMLADPGVAFVKAFYERPGDGHPRGGGRVTELVARPLLHILFPALAGTVQPLAGEFAGRRDVLELVPFVDGYGVDVGLLIDIARLAGVDAMVQVDLGRRVHRNRPLPELGPMATIVALTLLHRAGLSGLPAGVVLDQPDLAAVAVEFSERPPLSSLRQT